VLHIVAESRRF